MGKSWEEQQLGQFWGRSDQILDPGKVLQSLFLSLSVVLVVGEPGFDFL